MIHNILPSMIGSLTPCRWNYYDVTQQLGTFSTTSQVKPFYGLYNYSISASIYNASLFGDSNCQITGAQIFFQSFTTPYTVNNQEIWIGEISNSTFPTTTPQVDFSDLTFVRPLTKVKTFNLTITNNGTWHNFDFDTPYCYSGLGNIIFVWKNYDGSWAAGYGNSYVGNVVSKAMYKGFDANFPTGTGTRDNFPLLVKFNTKVNNVYSTADGAYSLRLLNSAYTGNCITVRRSSDSATQTIGFVNGTLDTAALSAFITGSTNGFVTTWYDQSGNGYDRSNGTTTQQPMIVSGGTILTANGKPTMYFDGTNDNFVQQSPTLADNGATVFSVAKLDPAYATNNEYPLIGGLANYSTRFGVNNNKYFIINSTTNAPITGGTVTTSLNLHTAIFNTTDKLRLNETEIISGNAGTSGSGAGTYIGRSWLGKYWFGNISEVLIYATDPGATNLMFIENKLKNYYGL